ncbi:MAG: ABC transporter ATP-binding protein/permease [Clostridiales bacterium]|nr:ABC transporter ATP-binding protein/permease [Clostridiales bacterium]
MNRRTIGLLARLVRENGRYFFWALIFTVFTVVIEYLTPIVLAETLDYYLQGKPSRMPGFVNAWVDSLGGPGFMAKNLWIAGLALVILNVVGGAFNFGKGRLQSIAGENVSLSLRERLYTHIQNLPFAYHVKAETGDLVQRCTSDVETVRRFLSMQLMQVANALMMVAFAVFYLFRENAKIALISMVMVPALFLFAWLFFRWVVKSFRLADEAEGKMSAVLQENLTGVRVVRAFGQQEHEVEKFEAVSGDYKKKSFRICVLLAVYWATGDLISMVQSMMTLLACVFFAVRGEITVGTLIIFTSYIWKLLFPIRQLGRILSDAGKSSVAMERIDEVMREKEEPEEKDALKPSLRGDIVFDRVTFGYDESHPVLRDMSFTIPAGKTVAILGATGSGKSTLVHLLQRLFDVKNGEIRIGETPISRIDRKYLRSRVGLILQEPFLYSKTLKENVTIASPNATDAEIDRAVTDAAAKEFIEDSEKGYDTVVGERGVTLSGGQKQRVAIARTLMKDSDILIFDDSLSAVDTETDARIREALKERKQGVTTLIISHRIVTLSQADRILVLEDGRITQQGTHAELIREDGLYQRIFRIQSDLEDEFKEENTAYAAN